MWYVNGDTIFLMGEGRVVWAVAPDGRGYRSEDSYVLWPMGVYGDGLVVAENNSIALIGTHGTTEWRYSFAADSLNTEFIVGNDTIILVSNDKINRHLQAADVHGNDVRVHLGGGRPAGRPIGLDVAVGPLVS